MIQRRAWFVFQLGILVNFPNIIKGVLLSQGESFGKFQGNDLMTRKRLITKRHINKNV